MVLTTGARASERREIAIAATNINGLGASQLVRSLLPAIARVETVRISELWLPSDGAALEDQMAGSTNEIARRYFKRRLPNALSRFVECMFLGQKIAGNRDLFVLGDLPYRITGRQVVFVQTPFLVSGSRSTSRLTTVKSAISRWVFRANLPRVHRVIVQTKAMADGMLRSYPVLRDRIEIIGQPPPLWLLSTSRDRPHRSTGQALHLFFPASPYAHKNHLALIRALDHDAAISRLDLTIGAEEFPAVTDARVVFRGVLSPAEVIRCYRQCDALAFPSLEESYGLPLVEAMFLGLPILAADRPYARALCGDEAIYFNPNDPLSLAEATRLLRNRLDDGWYPDWRRQLALIPRDWDEVASKMMAQFDNE